MGERFASHCPRHCSQWRHYVSSSSSSSSREMDGQSDVRNHGSTKWLWESADCTASGCSMHCHHDACVRLLQTNSDRGVDASYWWTEARLLLYGLKLAEQKPTEGCVKLYHRLVIITVIIIIEQLFVRHHNITAIAPYSPRVVVCRVGGTAWAGSEVSRPSAPSH